MNDNYLPKTPQEESWMPQPGAQPELQAQATESQKPNSKPLPHGIKTILNVIIIVVLIIVVLAAIFLIMLMGIPASNGTTTSIISVFLAIGLGIILPLFIATTLLRKINAGPNPEPTKFFAESAKNTLIKIMAASIAILMVVVIISFLYLSFITK